MSTETLTHRRPPSYAPLIRPPSVTDAASIGSLAASLQELDRYATYLYVLLCDHFADSCALALAGDQVVGFVTGYRKPTQHDTLFVWQVGTAPAARGRGLAGAMLDDILRRPAQRDVRYLETTVTADNVASRRLFGALARRLETSLYEHAGYGAELFPLPHQAEPLLRLGAFARRTLEE